MPRKAKITVVAPLQHGVSNNNSSAINKYTRKTLRSSITKATIEKLSPIPRVLRARTAKKVALSSIFSPGDNKVEVPNEISNDFLFQHNCNSSNGPFVENQNLIGNTDRHIQSNSRESLQEQHDESSFNHKKIATSCINPGHNQQQSFSTHNQTKMYITANQLSFKDRLQLLNKAPQFSGEPDEDFELWKIDMESFCDDLALDEYFKFTSLKNAVRGIARRLILSNSNLKTSEKIYQELANTFGFYIRTTDHLEAIKQGSDEFARTFGQRVIYEVKKMGYNSSIQPVLYEYQIKNTFIRGLRKEIVKNINIVHVRDFKEAVRIASDLDHLLLKSSESPKTFLSFNSISDNANHDLSQKQSSYRKQMTCFQCGKPGHSFRECSDASEKDISVIKAKLPEFIQNIRKDKPTRLNVSFVAPDSPTQNLPYK